MSPPAVGPLLADATQRLAAAGVASPRVDAELLLAALIGVSRGDLVTRSTIPAATGATYDEQIVARIARTPLQHLTGRAPFRYTEVAVGPGVFVPRPETELLVDAVLAHLRTLPAPVVVDLCAGSGALALAVADEVPAARVVAVESSASAGRWLARNAAGTAVQVVVGDVRDPELLRGLYGEVDAVLANPPYVPLSADVAPEVLADPRGAVFAGPDGLDLLPVIVTRTALLLRPGGRAAIEHDETQAEAVPALLAEDGRFVDIVDHHDLTGRPRYVAATRD